MTNRAHVLLWTDNTAAYVDAIKAAGLADRVSVDTLPRREKPSPDQLGRTEAMLAAACRPACCRRMPKLRWAQALTAGVEGWLALPDLPPGLDLDLRARHASGNRCRRTSSARCSTSPSPMPTAAANKKAGKWMHTRRPAAQRQDARHPRPRRHRPGSGAPGDGASACG